jgi:hypothetical protein
MTQIKPIYTTFSWLRFSKNLIFGIAIIYIIASIFLGLNFNDEININAVIVVIFLMVLLIIKNSKELVVYESKLQIKKTTCVDYSLVKPTLNYLILRI